MGSKSNLSNQKHLDQLQDDDDDDDESIQDEYAHRHIEILSDKLQEMKEKFAELIEKVMGDEAITLVKHKSAAEDETTDTSSESDEMSIKEEEDTSGAESDEQEEEEEDKENVAISEKQPTTIESVIQQQARQINYLKYLEHYPKIMEYLSNDDPTCDKISRNDLEPFMKKYIAAKPTEKMYERLTDEIQHIHRRYLNSRQ